MTKDKSFIIPKKPAGNIFIAFILIILQKKYFKNIYRKNYPIES